MKLNRMLVKAASDEKPRIYSHALAITAESLENREARTLPWKKENKAITMPIEQPIHIPVNMV